MIELIIERWSSGGKDAFHWSLWQDGRRIAMESEGHSDAEACEAEGLDACRRLTGRAPDRTTRL